MVTALRFAADRQQCRSFARVIIGALRRAVSRKSQNPTRLIRLDHDVAFEKFSALVLREERRLAEIEKTLGINSPDSDFRNSLIRGLLWGFYRRCLPGKISRRKALKQALHKAARSAEALETSSALIWNAADPATRNPLLSRFGAIGPNWRPVPSAACPGLTCSANMLSRCNCLATHCPMTRAASILQRAFDALMRFLAEHYYAMAATWDLPSDFFRFAGVVTDLLRSIEPKQRAAVFKLPPNDDALRRETSADRLWAEAIAAGCHAMEILRCSERVHLHITRPTCPQGWP